MKDRESNTSERLQTLLNERNMTQADLVRLCEPYSKTYGIKMSKTNISNYVNGIVEPNAGKLSILGMALNVSEVWLMGYNVSRSRTVEIALNERELKLIAAYRLMDEGGKTLVDLLVERESQKHSNQ